ncbi:TetR/AcrR family transcriptional regulator [Planococcus soli]|uniref:TetR/AcrR family transcriptional regulator n=1 Tax=Planococcus soli TaxID=2666072 RepID=UPI00115F1BDD|nr:TetR/AcrR family transcriptional regulator [Planococcus soli]
MEKFESLDPDKQKKILDSALMEFAEKGYGQASTNRIVKQAGIGKGMLFYYFKNKKDLYEYLIEYSLNFIIDSYLSLVDKNEADFIKRLKGACQIKMKAQMENEHVFNFMGTVMLTKDLDLPPHLQKRYEQLQQQGYELLYEGIDKTLFRKDVDVDKAFNLIRWGVDGYQQDLLQRLQGKKMTELDFDPYWDEFYAYIEILKKSFYTT